MYFKRLLIYSIFLIIYITTVVCLKKDEYYCEKSSPCVCISIQDNNIDLTGVSLTLGLATNVSLNYQPCPVDGTSSNAIQIVNATSNTIIPLAYYKDSKFLINDAVTLVYTNATDVFDVILSCNQSATKGNEYLTNFQNDTINHLTITLKTSQVCGLNLKDAIENSSSESWTLFFSFILVVGFVYFVCGSVMNACLFNKIGINMIPHHAFWTSLYNNVKEKLCGTSMMASAYESI
ncbi:Mannose-6-phosphate receptor binding domain,Autophagy-related protein 27 [Cinara cedri]|uniref:Mannose-6-phosphate receptor binding domain,Autophagy-related protein 27 n=1 Tax=Cinara cedri TaxID=506608 RepID=A0A5E4MRG5_9HEMI|nr:Mannose-6-phosphate receptor binding domain,Autophagy-related protein 27 [Cinara cedri]